MRWWLAAAVAFVPLATAAVAAAPSHRSRSVSRPRLANAHPCAARGFTCATLSVPLLRGARSSRALKLQVAAATNARAPRGVLLVLTGGPGESGAWAAPAFARLLGPVARAYRVVSFDQRGTGTTALDCPALQRQMGASDLRPPSAPAVRACAAKIGTARAAYGTDDVVRDIEDLRRALHASKLTLDGTSYGTFVAERYAIAHPGRVARLVLDSVVPHHVNALAFATPYREVARVLRSACAAANCTTDPAADLAEVVRRRRNGPRLLDAITFLSIADPSFSQAFDLFHVLARARDGDLSGLDRLVSRVQRWERYPSNRLSQGLHASALCSDWRFPWGNSSAPVARRGRLLARAVAAIPREQLWPFDRRTAAGNGFIRQCLYWPPTEPTPAVASKLPRVPTLLLAGTHDLSTPLAVGARRELPLAPGGKLVTVDGAGHSVQARDRSGAGRRAVRTFLLRTSS